jgi:hypothetical protein
MHQQGTTNKHWVLGWCVEFEPQRASVAFRTVISGAIASPTRLAVLICLIHSSRQLVVGLGGRAKGGTPDAEHRVWV